MVQVVVFDPTDYWAYQVYADNVLVEESRTEPFDAGIKKNTKIDVVGITAEESGLDFGRALDDQNGPKVKVQVPIEYQGREFKLYGDKTSGTIDYGRAITSGTISEALPAWSTFTLDQWQQFTLDEWASFELDPTYAQFLVTERLANGTHKLALVNYTSADYFHRPYIFEKTISSRPDEITPFVESYDPNLDVLVIGTDDNRVGTYSVYAAPWNAEATEIDFSNPIATAENAPISISEFRGEQADSYRYLSVRKTLEGIEEQNTTIIRLELSGSDWEGNIPTAPTHLTASLFDSDRVRLAWQYRSGIAPDGFHVYRGETDGISYASPVATVPYAGSGVFAINLSEISGTKLFAVRAYRGELEEQNAITISISSDPAPIDQTPLPPTNLSATIRPGNRVLLTWFYQAKNTNVTPEGFNIYSGVGTVEYSEAIESVQYVADGIINFLCPAIEETTTYSVRAYRGGNEDSNTEQVSVEPLAGPDLVAAQSTLTWKSE